MGFEFFPPTGRNYVCAALGDSNLGVPCGSFHLSFKKNQLKILGHN